MRQLYEKAGKMKGPNNDCLEGQNDLSVIEHNPKKQKNKGKVRSPNGEVENTMISRSFLSQSDGGLSFVGK